MIFDVFDSFTVFVYLLPPARRGNRLKIFIAPKNFYDFRPVHEKNRLKLAHFLQGGTRRR